MSQTPSPVVQRSPLEALLPHWQIIAYGLIGAGVAMGIIPLVNSLKYDFNNPPLCVWAGSLGVLLVAAGVIYLTMPRGRNVNADVDNLRMLILAVLAAAGFLTAIFGLVLPFVQYREELSGGLEDWRKHATDLTWCIAAFMGGLVLMFVGLALGRTYERTQAGLRRLMYGYNAVLTCLLLLLIVTILNVLCYSPVYPFSKLRTPVDWTSSGIYTLQPATKNLIGNLDQPVKIYALMPANTQVSEQVVMLLQNTRSVNERVQWELVSPQLSQERYDELAKKYQIAENGLLVLYGTEPNIQSEAIPLTELFKLERDDTGRVTKLQFTGEPALYKTLTYLSEGKARAKIYFTQGNGELDFNDRSPTQKKDVGLGLFIEQLGKGNYDLQPLPFDKKALLENKDIPDDADVVVIPGPHAPLAPEAIEALQAYMRKPHGPDGKKGKLILMLEVVRKGDGTMLQTGLEPMLREYGVEAGNNEVLAIRNGYPGSLEVIANPRTAIGRAFNNEAGFTSFLFIDARTVSPAAAPPGQESSFVAEGLVFTSPEVPVWAEEDLAATVSPGDLVKQMRTDPKKQREKLKTTLPLGVTVTESKGGMMPPGHPPGPSKDKTPRMVVFGDASWACNGAIGATEEGAANADLGRSCLAWLRERQNLGATPDVKDRETYTFTASEATTGRLKWLPGILMLIGVATIGGGVWVVRRR